MSAVVDASTIVAALVDAGPIGEWSERVLATGACAPELVHVEVANILRRLERSKRISTAEANGAYEDLNQLAIESYPFQPFAERVWELRGNLTSYDAWHVALAEALELPLATLDERLTRSNGPTCPFLTPHGR